MKASREYTNVYACSKDSEILMGTKNDTQDGGHRLGVRWGGRAGWEKRNMGALLYIFISEIGQWPQLTCLILHTFLYA